MNLNARLRGFFVVGLVAAAALYGLAPAQASPRYENRRAPDTGKPPIIIPPVLNIDKARTGIDAARDARLADEHANTRMATKWAKRFEETKDAPKQDKKTGKWGFKGSNETFHSYDTARDAWGVMVNVYDLLKDGDVAGAKKIWKKAKKEAEGLWYGRQRGEKIRDIRYGDGKDAKAHGKSDEKAHGNVLDSTWHDLKSAEASGLKPVKTSAPVTD